MLLTVDIHVGQADHSVYVQLLEEFEALRLAGVDEHLSRDSELRPIIREGIDA